MSNDAEDNEFYEEDEPLEDVVLAFEQGERGVTGPPQQIYAFVSTATGNVGAASVEIPLTVSAPVAQWAPPQSANAGSSAALGS